MSSMLNSVKAAGSGPRLLREELGRQVAVAHSTAALTKPILGIKSLISGEIVGAEMLNLFSASLRNRLSVWSGSRADTSAMPRLRGQSSLVPTEEKRRTNLDEGVRAMDKMPGFSPVPADGQSQVSFLWPDQASAQDSPGSQSHTWMENSLTMAAIDDLETDLVLPNGGGFPGASMPAFSDASRGPNLTRLETALKQYFSSSEAGRSVESAKEPSIFSSPREEGTMRPLKSAPVFHPLSNNRGLIESPRAESAAAARSTGFPVVPTAANSADWISPFVSPEPSGWQLEAPLEGRSFLEAEALSRADLPDSIAAILREQAVAHGIDLT